MDPTITGLIITGIVGLAGFGQWYEARRQRLLTVTEKGVEAPNFETQDASANDLSIWRCGVYDYPPLSNITSRYPFVAEGPLIALARRVLEKLDREPVFFEFTYRDFYNGRPPPELILGMFRTDRRTKVMHFSRPIYQIGLQGICRLDLQGDLHQQMRNGDLRIAIYDGEVGWEYVEENLQGIPDEKVIKVSGGRQLETMEYLKNGMYDIVIMDELSCVNFLENGDNKAHFKLAFKRSLDEYKACFAVSRKLEHLLPSINDALERARNDPQFQELEEIALHGYDIIVPKGIDVRR